jgi:hypothetical protein
MEDAMATNRKIRLTVAFGWSISDPTGGYCTTCPTKVYDLQLRILAATVYGSKVIHKTGWLKLTKFQAGKSFNFWLVRGKGSRPPQSWTWEVHWRKHGSVAQYDHHYWSDPSQGLIDPPEDVYTFDVTTYLTDANASPP